MLRSALSEAVRRAVEGEKAPAVLFSGGLDSSVLAILAQKHNKSTTLITAGTENSEDLEWARKYAAKLGMALVEIVLDDEEIRRLFNETKKITGEKSFMKIELGLVLLALCERAKKGGINVLISGSGAEELFLGYNAHSERNAKGEDLEALRKNELDGLYAKDLARGEKIASRCGVEIRLPFLDENAVKAALSAPAGDNFEGGENKAVLRKAARGLGLPAEICARQKRAMQYGSGVHERLIRMRNRWAISI